MTRRRLPKDHFVPQGYLRGFIHPSRVREQKPLWVFATSTRSWSEKSPAEIGFARGFYTARGGPAAHFPFDRLFADLERDLPASRESIRQHGYPTWIHHRSVLVRAAAVFSARTDYFLAEATAASGGQPQARDQGLATMANELLRRPMHWEKLHWALRVVHSPDDGLPTADSPVQMEGSLEDPRSNPSVAMSHPDTALLFPLAWDMLLMGSPQPWPVPTAPLPRPSIERLRARARESATDFFVSPLPLIG